MDKENDSFGVFLVDIGRFVLGFVTLMVVLEVLFSLQYMQGLWIAGDYWQLFLLGLLFVNFLRLGISFWSDMRKKSNDLAYSLIPRPALFVVEVALQVVLFGVTLVSINQSTAGSPFTEYALVLMGGILLFARAILEVLSRVGW